MLSIDQPLAQVGGYEQRIVSDVQYHSEIISSHYFFAPMHMTNADMGKLLKYSLIWLLFGPNSHKKLTKNAIR